MDNVKRWYIYVTTLISLQGVTWAVIALLRNLFISGNDPLTTALQLAVIIVGLPVFLGHWLWGQRLADREAAERHSVARWLYLYATLTAFLMPLLTNLYDLLGTLLRAPGTVRRINNWYNRYDYTLGDTLLFHLIAILILGVLWFYHQRMTVGADKEIADEQGIGTVRRLYIYLFSATGLTMVALVVIHLIRWVMVQFGSRIVGGGATQLTDELVRLVIGLPLWIVFWRWGGKLHEGGVPSEAESALRKFYLHSTVFVAVLTVVGNGTLILSGFFRRLLDLPSQGDIREPLPLVIGGVILWLYHAAIIREEARGGQNSEQMGILRAYRYLTAGIGFAALLVGLGGVLSVIIQRFERGALIGDTREVLAWSVAGIIMGLIVWILPFRTAQGQTTDEGAPGAEARRSLARKIYLYIFLFIGVMTVLSAGVFIVFRLLTLLLNIETVTLSEMAHALGFAIIAAANWLFHGALLRADRKLSASERVKELELIKIAILDLMPGTFGNLLVRALRDEIPGLTVEPLLVDAPTPEGGTPVTETIRQAGLIVAPWNIAVPGAGNVPAAVTLAVAESPARKLLIPLEQAGWDWVGVEAKDNAALVKPAAAAVRQIIEGEKVRTRKIGCGGWLAIIIGVIVLFTILGQLFQMLYYLF